jgi:hypothetical protein
MAAPKSPEKCSNTGCSNALDTTGTPKWCKECRARYQRENKALRMSRAESEGYYRGYREGVNALRKLLIDELVTAGAGMMRANEVAVWIGSVATPTPTLSEESESDESQTNDAAREPAAVSK